MLFNIFGGITRCDEVAKGLIEAFAQIKPTVPFVVRLDGTNDEEGRALLAEADLPNVHTEATMHGAAAKVVELAPVMSVLVDTDTRLCVSGITGREGTFHALNNRATARRSSPASRPARAARTSRASRSSTRSTTRSPRPAPTRR